MSFLLKLSMKVEFFQGESLIGQSWKTLDSISLEIFMYFLRKSADLWQEIQISSNLQNWHFITKEKMLKLKTSMQAWSLQFVIYFNTRRGALFLVHFGTHFALTAIYHQSYYFGILALWFFKIVRFSFNLVDRN